MRTMIVTAVTAAFGLMAVAAPTPKADKKTLEDQLVGKWKLVKTNDEAVDLDFFIVYKKGGEMEFHRGQGENAQVSKGKYTAKDPDKEYKLGSIDWTVNESGESRGEVSKILILSEDKLKFEDPQGVTEEFERVKEKKEDKKDDKKEDKKDK